NTDACLNSCELARCGDGVQRAGEEACDDGNLIDTDACLSSCVEARCGDSLVYEGVEACDDGNEVDRDDCRNGCRLNQAPTMVSVIIQPAVDVVMGTRLTCVAVAADADQDPTSLAFVWLAEGAPVAQGATFEVVQDPGVSITCRVTVSDYQGPGGSDTASVRVEHRCGDGIVGPEECDDGNQVDTDACLNGCRAARCGDNVIQAGVEDCDDGNNIDGDACSATCVLEAHYNFTAHTFTPCSSSGTGGPSLAQCRVAYGAAAWAQDAQNLAVSSGVQVWRVPANGNYRIEVFGAQGGVNHTGMEGGRGARMRGDFALVAGQQLHIVVGQKGVRSPNGNQSNGGSGGGGGSFVSSSGAQQPLIVGGGGGGSGLHNNGDNGAQGADGTTSTSGTTSKDNRGQGGVGGADAPNGGGHGWNSVRTQPIGATRMNDYGGDGGFGGGGGGGFGTCSNPQHIAGGGGGYSGGGVAVTCYFAGGGGGSYNTGANRSDSSGARSGSGQVTITRL
ncbi:MAG: DUF4215 domain-containing protein, partial [Myxococcota bacterium]|nr:DUF4215 domain-containing protein [Myxococcota bacterium]